ncbi:VENN motif pre-toxin domain-containing protein, partial [Enterobacter sp. ESY66]|nr:VENN motif pre-toxin domain-containing protein [Cronobacter sakazakii]
MPCGESLFLAGRHEHTYPGIAGGLAGENTAGAATGAAAGKNSVENNALGDKDKLPVNIFDINPLKPNVLDADGDPLTGGGAAKGGK